MIQNQEKFQLGLAFWNTMYKKTENENTACLIEYDLEYTSN